ncbi:hypothetical protein KVT40_002608 [Elsinoe batatas]|uniref:DUF7918 domain-containing protein n=1 Tax=Elsinoe batatas TaxID=2601811 RepID=A0A8K0L5X6_9PEZI|nr:hypothetical protein KVT40_002608 [Elsinoe batatas]
MHNDRLPGLSVEVQDGTNNSFHEHHHQSISDIEQSCLIDITPGARFTVYLQYNRNVHPTADRLKLLVNVDGHVVDSRVLTIAYQSYRCIGKYNRDFTEFREMFFAKVVLGDRPSLMTSKESIPRYGTITVTIEPADQINTKPFSWAAVEEGSLRQVSASTDVQTLDEVAFKGKPIDACAAYGAPKPTTKPTVCITTISRGPTYKFQFQYAEAFEVKQQLGGEMDHNVKIEKIGDNERFLNKSEHEMRRNTAAGHEDGVTSVDDDDDNPVFVKSEDRSKRPRVVVDLTGDDEKPRKRRKGARGV